jgi:hypothetical protein
MSNVLGEIMANQQWLLEKTLESLQSDVEWCERATPSRNSLGTLRVNLEVCRKNLSVATPEQMVVFQDLEKRALIFLNP